MSTCRGMCRAATIRSRRWNAISSSTWRDSSCPGPAPKEVIEWQVQDPFGASIEAYRAVRDDLEQRVMRLILEMRKQSLGNNSQTPLFATEFFVLNGKGTAA